MKRVRPAAAALAGLIVIASTLSGAGAAYAASLVVTANSTITSGTSTTLGAAWGSDGPYKVNFICGVPGCANFTSASTAATSIFRYHVAVATCSGVTYTTRTTIWEDAGAGASVTGTTVTTWTKGKVC